MKGRAVATWLVAIILAGATVACDRDGNSSASVSQQEARIAPGGADAGASPAERAGIESRPDARAVRRGANDQYEVPGFFTLLLGMLVLLGMVWLLDRRSRRSEMPVPAAECGATAPGKSATGASARAPLAAPAPASTGPEGGPGPVQQASQPVQSETERQADDVPVTTAALATPAASTTPTVSTTPAASSTPAVPATPAVSDAQPPYHPGAGDNQADPARKGKDDLTRIKGIGMKTSRLLNQHGIRTYADVSAASPDSLNEILREAGPMFASNDPQTWPEQASLAMRGQWDQVNAGYGSNGVKLAQPGSEVTHPESAGNTTSDASTPAGLPPAKRNTQLLQDTPITGQAAAAAPLGGMVRDDLTRIAGIGPKASDLLREAGIGSFAQLASTDVNELKRVLETGGSRFALLDPSTWGQQAAMAANGQWDELSALQYEMSRSASGASPAPGSNTDDLTRIEGIGPKIAALLHEAGIAKFSNLAATPVPQLQQLLSDAGARFALADPGTWPEQAALAASERWADLKRLQDELDGGKRI